MKSVAFRLVLVLVMTLGATTAGGTTAPAVAELPCSLRLNLQLLTHGGAQLDNWTSGQVATVKAEAWLAPSDCIGTSDAFDWTIEIWLWPCGPVPLASGSEPAGSLPNDNRKTITTFEFEFPTHCPPGTGSHEGEPLEELRGGPLHANFAVQNSDGSGNIGAALDFYNYVDGKADEPCPDGQATGDSGCGDFQGDPVNSLTGAFATADKDFSMPVRGGELGVWRSYDSQLTRVGAMGRGWTYAYSDALVVEPNSKVTWRTSQGASVVFPFDSGTTWKVPYANSARLTQSIDGSFTVTTEDKWSLAFTSAGVFTAATDRNGRVFNVGRDSAGRVASVSASGRSLTYAYGTTGLLTSITARSASLTRQTTFTYSGGRLASVKKPDSSTTLYAYDAGGRLVSMRNSATSTPQLMLTYGSDGRVASQKDGNGNVTTFGWDASTSTATMTDPRGGQWKDVYDRGWLVKQVDPTGVETLFDYTNAGQLFRIRGPLGQEEIFNWDTSGRLVKRFNAAGNAVSSAYSSTNREPTSVVDFGGRTTAFGYDANRNLTTVTPPITSAKTTTGYASDTFDVTTFKDPTQQTTSFTSDPATGDPRSVTTPLGNKTTMTTNAFGQIASTTPAPGNAPGATGTWSTTYARDAVGRVKTVTSPLGVVSTLTYDKFGRILTAKDGRGKITTYAYDNAGHVKKVTRPDASTEQFTYDANGNIATRTDGRAHVTTFGYDAANRVTSVNKGGRIWHTTYDAAGRPRSVEAPSGRTTTFDYDVRSMVTKVDYSDNTPDVTIDYDALGRRSSVTDGTGTWGYTYDDLDRPLTITHGSDQWTYTWDAAGRMASRQAPGQAVTSYAYDLDGRLVRVTRAGVNLATYEYDTATNTVKRTQANGVTTLETLDRNGNLASSVEKDTAGITIQSLTYTRDLAGNPTKVVNKDGKTTVSTFDNRNRLSKICYATTSCTGATNFIGYVYDANNNITQEDRPSVDVTRVFDAHDQLTSETRGTAATTFAYDADGNQTRAGGTDFTVDAAGQITSSTTGGTATTFAHTGSGLLASATTAGTTTTYDYDPMSAQLVGERTGGTLTHQFVYGRELVAMTTGSGTDYYTTDPLGSVLATRDSTGAAKKAYAYEPYGLDRATSGTGTTSPLRFAGGLDLGDTNYRFGLRQYSASTDSFSTPDPAGTSDTYSYASGNPLVYADPMGLWSISNPLQAIGALYNNTISATGGALLGNPAAAAELGGSGTYAGGTLDSRVEKSVGGQSDELKRRGAAAGIAVGFGIGGAELASAGFEALAVGSLVPGGTLVVGGSLLICGALYAAWRLW